jgi:hypothetical protein
LSQLLWFIVVFDGDKAQYMILTHNRMHSMKKNTVNRSNTEF